MSLFVSATETDSFTPRWATVEWWSSFPSALAVNFPSLSLSAGQIVKGFWSSSISGWNVFGVGDIALDGSSYVDQGAKCTGGCLFPGDVGGYKWWGWAETNIQAVTPTGAPRGLCGGGSAHIPGDPVLTCGMNDVTNIDGTDIMLLELVLQSTGVVSQDVQFCPGGSQSITLSTGTQSVSIFTTGSSAGCNGYLLQVGAASALPSYFLVIACSHLDVDFTLIPPQWTNVFTGTRYFIYELAGGPPPLPVVPCSETPSSGSMPTLEVTRDLDADWDDESTFYITQDVPLPFTLRGLVLRMSYNPD